MSGCICGGGISPFGCASKYWLVETAPKLRQRPLIRTTARRGGHLNALCRCDHFFFDSEFRFLSLKEDCFLHSCLRRDTWAFISCLFSGIGVRLHCRDSNGRGAADLAHCWTGSIVSLVAKTVCSNVYTAPQIKFSPQCTGSRRVNKRIVYTGFRREYVAVKVWFIFAYLQSDKHGSSARENTATAR